ncbi:hypothetical protein D3C79_852190 [compost metagenome]
MVYPRSCNEFIASSKSRFECFRRARFSTRLIRYLSTSLAVITTQGMFRSPKALKASSLPWPHTRSKPALVRATVIGLFKPKFAMFSTSLAKTFLLRCLGFITLMTSKGICSIDEARATCSVSGAS